MSLSEFTRVWTKALANTCYVPMTRAEKIRFLYELTLRLAESLHAEKFEPAIANRIGADLANADFTAPEALARTVALVHDRLLADLGLSGDEARRRLTEVIEALTTGHAWATRHRTLDEQDELRKASLDARIKLEQALRASEARFRHAALHDPLTGLPNRTFFTNHLAKVITSHRAGLRIGVCFVDIDRFKAVNDSLGHPLGDDLLLVIGHRLLWLAAESGYVVARIGGDKFAILIEGTTCADDAAKVADKVLAAISEPVQVGQQQLSITASAGIVELAAADADPTDLMRGADMTLHWAKADGTSHWALFDAERNAAEVARYELSAQMPAALANGEFTLAYQPLIELATGLLVGVEALARWQHPQRGLIGADDFVSLAEDTGLIVPLGRYLLEQACQRAVQWRKTFPDPPFVSVNVSGRQISHPGLVANVAAILDSTGLPPEQLQLEITESAITGYDDQTLGTLQGLANLGVRIAIDDFGTGYSNLAYLCDLPVHGLKLAAQFLHRSRRRANGTRDALLANLVAMGHTLDLTITAEGIETAAQARRLRKIGCDIAQGYHFGRPDWPEEIFKEWA